MLGVILSLCTVHSGVITAQHITGPGMGEIEVIYLFTSPRRLPNVQWDKCVLETLNSRSSPPCDKFLEVEFLSQRVSLLTHMMICWLQNQKRSEYKYHQNTTMRKYNVPLVNQFNKK